MVRLVRTQGHPTTASDPFSASPRDEPAWCWLWNSVITCIESPIPTQISRIGTMITVRFSEKPASAMIPNVYNTPSTTMAAGTSTARSPRPTHTSTAIWISRQ